MTPEIIKHFNCKLLHRKYSYWDGSYIFSEEEKKFVPNIQSRCKICEMDNIIETVKIEL